MSSRKVNLCGIKLEIKRFGIASAISSLHDPNRKIDKYDCVDCMEREENRLWKKCKNLEKSEKSK